MKSFPTFRCAAFVLAAALAVFATGDRAVAIGFVLGESKEELKLGYDVSVQDHGTGRVTVVLTLADEGRLQPLDEVELVIPAQTKNKDGSFWMDLVVSIDMKETDRGQRVGRVHILKELAARAEIRLNTHTMDGKIDPFTRLHHVIPVAKYLESAKSTAKKSAAPRDDSPRPPASEQRPASERK